MTRIAIGAAVLLMTVAGSARAQATGATRAVRVDAGVVLHLQQVEGFDYTKVDPPIAGHGNLLFGVTVVPKPVSVIAVMVEFTPLLDRYDFHVQDAAGRSIYSDRSVSERTISELVGLRLGSGRTGETTVSFGLGQVFRTYAIASHFDYNLYGPPTDNLTEGSMMVPALIGGADVAVVNRRAAVMFKLRFRVLREPKYYHLGLGWTLSPGLTVRF